MRNLKRVLSLTLASVMLLGMMVIGASAAQGYDDVDDSYNVEAIEVLQAIDVMAGDAGTNNFRPDSSVTRGEMARIMAALMDLDYDYYSAAGIHPFNDMVGHWAEPYAAACKANGIIAGRTEITYDPDAYVTAVEAASMMMRALGYFKYSSDYAGGFEVATVLQGTQIGIFDGVGSSASTPMNRNQVAQLALNTLKSGMVEPDDSTISITTPDGTTVQAGKVIYNYRTVSLSNRGGTNLNNLWATAISDKQTSSIGSQNTGTIVELGEQLYNGDLKLVEDTDAFGRPVNRWTYKTSDIGKYSKNLIASYTDTVKDGALYNLLGSTVYDRGHLSYYIDGVYRVDADVKAANISGNSIVGSRGTSNNDVPGTGKGVLTEVFLDSDTYDVTIVVTNTYVAEVIADYDESRDAVSIEVKETHDTVYTKGNSDIQLDCRIEPSVIGAQVGGVLYGDDFPMIADLQEGDYILFTYSAGQYTTLPSSNNSGAAGIWRTTRNGNGLSAPPATDNIGTDAIETIQLAETVSGTITSITDADSTDTSATNLLKQIVLGGEPYSFNLNYTARGSSTDDRYELGSDAVVVLDAYGNVIWDAEAIASNGNFLYVDGIVRSTGFANRAVANVYFADGTNDIIDISGITVKYGPQPDNTNAPVAADPAVDSKGKVTLKDLSPSGTGNASGNGWYKALGTAYESTDNEYTQFDGWYSYTRGSDGTYKLTQLGRFDLAQTVVTDVDKQQADYQTGFDGSEEISAGTARWYSDFTINARFAASNSTTFIIVKDDKIYTYEGVKNLPKLTGLDTNDVVTAVRKNKATSASVVLIISDDVKISGSVTEDLLYVIKLNSSYVKSGTGDDELIYVYDVIKGGVKTTIESKYDYTASPGAYKAWSVIDGYYELDDNDNNDAPAGDRLVVGEDEFVVGSGTKADNITYDGGVLTIGSNNDTYLVDSDTMIRVLLTKDNGSNKLLNSGDNRVLKTYTASGLAALDGPSATANPYQTGFTYDYFGVLTDDWGDSDTLKILYVIISQAD